MENLPLADKLITPDTTQVYAIIGDKHYLWDTYFEKLKERYSDLAAEWKFYRDAKSWLMQVARKKKTICWIVIVDNTFRITFWFGSKVESAIENSDLPEDVKDNFRNAKQTKIGRGLAIVIKDETDLEVALKLAEIKSKN